jgi:hypothetical protein
VGAAAVIRLSPLDCAEPGDRLAFPGGAALGGAREREARGMCWSGEASFALATVGFGATAYAAVKGDSPLLWAPLGYFAGMELLQGFTYSVIDQCGLPSNQLATMFGYLHIAFQPFFGCMLALYFVPERVRRAAMPWAMAVAGLSAAFMFLQIYPFDWAGTCRPGRTLCGPELCSVSGNWHIAWQLPLNALGEVDASWLESVPGFRILQGHGFLGYLFAMFGVPLIFGSWRIVIYHIAMGPMLARLLTDNPNEVPAVWCLLSIAFLLVVIETPVRGIEPKAARTT